MTKAEIVAQIPKEPWWHGTVHIQWDEQVKVTMDLHRRVGTAARVARIRLRGHRATNSFRLRLNDYWFEIIDKKVAELRQAEQAEAMRLMREIGT